jgi:hypothetical protein
MMKYHLWVIYLLSFISLWKLWADPTSEAATVPKIKSYFVQQNLFNKISVKENDDSIGYFLQENLIINHLNSDFVMGSDTEVGLALNHYFTLSWGYYFTIQNFNLSAAGSQGTFTSFTYQGIRVSYIPMAYSIFHPRISLLIWGDGSASSKDFPNPDTGSTGYSTSFNIIKPSVSLEVNIMNILRASLGLGYRYVWVPSGLTALDQNVRTNLRGVEVNLTVAVGTF